MHQLRRFAAEQLKGILVAAEQRRQHVQPLLLRQPVKAGVHHGGADLLGLRGVLLLVAQPVEKLVGIQIQLGGDLAQLIKLLPILLFQHLDEVLHQPVVQRNAVQKHLEGVLAGVGIGGIFLRLFLRLGRLLLRLLRQRLRRRQHILHGEIVIGFLGDLVAGRSGAGAHKGGDAHGRDLLLQLHGSAHFVGLGEGDAGGGRQGALADLRHVLDVIFK